MTRVPVLLLMWLLCLPLAVITGYFLATPTDLSSVGILGLVFMLLLTPIMLRWHHDLLIVSWNSFFIVFFLPGQPSLGIAVGAMSWLIAILTRTMRKDAAFISVPSVSRPLIMLVIVVLGTAFLTGGIGARALGSATFGGKRYMQLIGAVIGYFAMVSQAIPKERRVLMASLFFLSGLSGAMSDVIYAAGPSFYFLFTLFAANLASMQALSQDILVRYSGLTWGALAFCYYLYMRFGIEGLLDLSRPWRLGILAASVAAGMFGGFRSLLVILAIMFAVQFWLEGLHRTRYLPVILLIMVLVGGFTVLFIDRMPVTVQRSLSFLPINVDPVAKHDAMGSLDWRWQIWKVVFPEIPKYLLLGKGFSFSGTDLMLTQEAISRGYYAAYEDMLISGNYHHGVLTTVIPFGILGLLAFLWFCMSSMRVLIANFRYSPPELRTINTFLLAFFATRLGFFLLLYGQLELDMAVFAGTIGLSISLNNGVSQPKEALAALPEPALAEAAPRRLILAH